MDRSILTLMDALPGWFAGESWAAWRMVLAAMFGLPLNDEQLALFRRRSAPPSERVREAWLICGRRAGKSLVAALITLYLAVLVGYRLAPGERGVVMLLAADRRQARVLMRYIKGFFERIPTLAELVQRQTREAIDLKNRITIEIHTASFRSTRGYTIAAAICDEIAFWRSEDSANPDTEIISALRPGMATVPGALLLCISSPYARKGALWQAYKDHWAKDGDPVLVLQADTASMNPTVDPAVIAQAYEQDPAAAGAEYGAQFRTDVEAFVRAEVVEAVTVPGRHELAPILGLPYVACVDPAGGSGQDSFALGIAHAELRGDQVVAVLDCLRERRPPFSPEAVVTEFAATCASYRLGAIVGDRYAGSWPAEQFAKREIEYLVAERVKSECYRDTLPLLNSGRVELLDSARLATQLLGLERRTARGGRDSIDHGVAGHDDLANVACGALLLALQASAAAPVDLEPTEAELRQLRALQHEWGLGGAPIYDADGGRYEDNVVW